MKPLYKHSNISVTPRHLCEELQLGSIVSNGLFNGYVAKYKEYEYVNPDKTQHLLGTPPRYTHIEWSHPMKKDAPVIRYTFGNNQVMITGSLGTYVWEVDPEEQARYVEALDYTVDPELTPASFIRRGMKAVADSTITPFGSETDESTSNDESDDVPESITSTENDTSTDDNEPPLPKLRLLSATHAFYVLDTEAVLSDVEAWFNNFLDEHDPNRVYYQEYFHGFTKNELREKGYEPIDKEKLDYIEGANHLQFAVNGTILQERNDTGENIIDLTNEKFQELHRAFGDVYTKENTKIYDHFHLSEISHLLTGAKEYSHEALYVFEGLRMALLQIERGFSDEITRRAVEEYARYMAKENE